MGTLNPSNRFHYASLLVIVVIFFAVAFFFAVGRGEPKTILIQRGTPLRTVAEHLHEEGVIAHPYLFKILLRLTGGSHLVRAGEFQFHAPSSTLGALWSLYLSKPILHQVTIPEGWNSYQIADILAGEGLVDPKTFTDYALSKAAADKFHLKTPNLEGFLFPDTYFFSRIDGEEKIADLMVHHFLQKYDKDYRAEVENRHLTMEWLVTFASIIEKETGAPGEREIVSSVFYNRLQKKMRLQSDPTTIYGLKKFNKSLTTADLRGYTPYNTYVIPALPPGPISSPGDESLHAALHPATTKYFYFVSNNNGTHHFSETYSEHARHVTTLQVEPARKKREAAQKKHSND